jgi:molybdate transport system ATP-binding protein
MAGSFVEARLKNIRLDRDGRPVLRDIDWTIRPGERWVLVGGNGAGKTQLLKLIAGAVWPTPTGKESRTYRWRNEDWATPFEVQDEIAYVGPERQDKYERYGWNHSVERIVGTGLYRTDIPLDPLTADDRKHIASLLQRLSVDALAERPFLTLSYGQRRLVLLARALAWNPKLLLLDELLNGLDATNRANALRWLESTGRSKMPWVLSSHRAEDVPSAATHALVLQKGRVTYSGPIVQAPLAKWLDHAHVGRNASKRQAIGASVGQAPAMRDKAERGAGRAEPGAGMLASERMRDASERVDDRNAQTGRRVAKEQSRRGRRDSSAGASDRVLVRLTNGSVFLDGHEALTDISLTLNAGDCWVVHGPNGCGKSTLLRAIYGDHAIAVGGAIERDGIVPGVPLELFKRRVGFVAPHLQTDHPQHLTVAEVVQSGRHASIGLNDPATATDRAAARSALSFFGLARFESRTIRELSYGQLRRVLFARAWVNKPELLLLDEPFAGVDAPTRRSLLQHIEQLAARGTTVMMATHHREEWPHDATHELELREGRSEYCGPVRPSSLAPLRRTGSS